MIITLWEYNNSEKCMRFPLGAIMEMEMKLVSVTIVYGTAFAWDVFHTNVKARMSDNLLPNRPPMYTENLKLPI